MSEILESVLNFVFPKEQEVRALEDLTAQDLKDRLPKSAAPKENTISLFDYKHPDVRQLIWEIKYKKNKRLAFMCAELLAEELLNFLYEKKEFYPQTKFLLLPIPISDKRRKQRGYNQTELVSQYIKKMIPPICFCTETLRRSIHKASQTKKTRSEREKNVRGCFSIINPDHIRDNIVLVFDDVITTGATMDEVCGHISKHKPKEILRVTIAH